MRDVAQLYAHVQSAHQSSDLRAQLRHNTYVACRIDAQDPHPGRKVVAPTDAKGFTDAELVDAYLGYTPLAALFEATTPFVISDDARFEHTHIIGGSGHGKTQLLLDLIHRDLVRDDGPGLVVIDSQGDLIRTIARLDVSPALRERLVLIDPADVEFPVALSLFDLPIERMNAYGPAARERLLNGAIEIYEYVFSSLPAAFHSRSGARARV